MRALDRAVGTLARLLASKVTLGVCALVLAGSAVWGRYQDTVVAGEVECRSALAAELDVEMASSFKRIERGLVAIAQGDDTGLADVAEASENARDAFDRAEVRQSSAVEICAEETGSQVTAFVGDNQLLLGGVALVVVGLVALRNKRAIDHVQHTADDIHHGRPFRSRTAPHRRHLTTRRPSCPA